VNAKVQTLQNFKVITYTEVHIMHNVYIKLCTNVAQLCTGCKLRKVHSLQNVHSGAFSKIGVYNVLEMHIRHYECTYM
jgi:hypothetical protein